MKLGFGVIQQIKTESEFAAKICLLTKFNHNYVVWAELYKLQIDIRRGSKPIVPNPTVIEIVPK